MSFIIPNAGDTTGGNAYVALDQAEPDALDFEILGSSSGVFTGCAVTSVGSSTLVSVAAGIVVLKGVPYAVTASASHSIGSPPADKRFDLVVARISGGTATLQTVQGINSSTNPTFPKSKAVISEGTVDLTTDVVLAALLRVHGDPVVASNIVDKRVPISSSIPDQGTVVPGSLAGEPVRGTGSLYLQTTAAVGTTSNSGVWVKTTAGWIEMAQNLGSHVPIGSMLAWPSQRSYPANFVEADGRTLTKNDYLALWDVFQYDFGGSGATFNIPNINQKFLRGTTSVGETGTTGGSAAYTLPDTPYHSHGLNNHSHTLSHTHTGETGTENASHVHYPTGLDASYVYVVEKLGAGGPHSLNIVPATNGSNLGGAWVTQAPMQQENAAHIHYTTTSSQSTATTSQVASATTSTGGTITVPTVPPYFNTRWIIRASVG